MSLFYSPSNSLLIACVTNLVGGPACSNGSVRLANFDLNSYGRSEGRVEVCYNNEWGTVCDNGWDNSDATVACKQLGFEFLHSYVSSYFGTGSGSIWLDNVDCSADLSKLFSCSHSTDTSDCSHDDDAGVRCGCKSYTYCSI